ncbi:hypothetical protein C8Q78DRAFT_361794 [Trametes maxima]|nr:hypothetical protein C8Q78DRAFT_361794 [Trametes maxima]
MLDVRRRRSKRVRASRLRDVVCFCGIRLGLGGLSCRQTDSCYLLATYVRVPASVARYPTLSARRPLASAVPRRAWVRMKMTRCPGTWPLSLTLRRARICLPAWARSGTPPPPPVRPVRPTRLRKVRAQRLGAIIGAAETSARLRPSGCAGYRVGAPYTNTIYYWAPVRASENGRGSGLVVSAVPISCPFERMRDTLSHFVRLVGPLRRSTGLGRWFGRGRRHLHSGPSWLVDFSGGGRGHMHASWAILLHQGPYRTPPSRHAPFTAKFPPGPAAPRKCALSQGRGGMGGALWRWAGTTRARPRKDARRRSSRSADRCPARLPGGDCPALPLGGPGGNVSVSVSMDVGCGTWDGETVRGSRPQNTDHRRARDDPRSTPECTAHRVRRRPGSRKMLAGISSRCRCRRSVLCVVLCIAYCVSRACHMVRTVLAVRTSQAALLASNDENRTSTTRLSALPAGAPHHPTT